MVAMGLVTPSFDYWQDNNSYINTSSNSHIKNSFVCPNFCKISEVKTCMIDNDKCSSKHQDGLPGNSLRPGFWSY